MFYDQENNYKTIDDYINYYNNDKIKVKLKGLSPVKYRLQPSFGGQFISDLLW
mgnify:CR=1 FL=1